MAGWGTPFFPPQQGGPAGHPLVLGQRSSSFRPLDDAMTRWEDEQPLGHRLRNLGTVTGRSRVYNLDSRPVEASKTNMRPNVTKSQTLWHDIIMFTYVYIHI